LPPARDGLTIAQQLRANRRRCGSLSKRSLPPGQCFLPIFLSKRLRGRWLQSEGKHVPKSSISAPLPPSVCRKFFFNEERSVKMLLNFSILPSRRSLRQSALSSLLWQSNHILKVKQILHAGICYGERSIFHIDAILPVLNHHQRCQQVGHLINQAD